MAWIRAIGGAGRAIGAVGRASRRSANRLADRVQENRLNHPARSGVLVPGDPTPSNPSGDYLDFRGCARLTEAAAGPVGQFGLGTPVGLGEDRARAAPIGLLPEELTRHALVVGPTGSGKTFSILVPWIYQAMRTGASVVAVDGQGTLGSKIKSYVGQLGPTGARVAEWNYANPSSSLSWNWIAAANTPPRVAAAVTAILGPSPRDQKASYDPYHWDNDANILRALITFANAVSSRPLSAADLVKTLRSSSALGDRLYGRAGAPGFNDLDQLVGLSDEDFARRTHGALTALSSLAGADVTAATTAEDIDIDLQLSQHRLWLVATPVLGGETSSRLASLAIGMVLQRAAERYSQHLRLRPLYIFIDETSLVANRVPLDTAVSQLRSAGVSIVLGIQNLEQLKDEPLRDTVLGNTATQVYFAGTTPYTCEYLSRRMGTRPQAVTSVTRVGNDRQFSNSTEQVPTLGPRELAQLWGGDPAAIVLLQHPSRTRKPVLVDLHRAGPGIG